MRHGVGRTRSDRDRPRPATPGTSSPGLLGTEPGVGAGATPGTVRCQTQESPPVRVCPGCDVACTRPQGESDTVGVQSLSQMAARMSASTRSGGWVASITTAGVVGPVRVDRRLRVDPEDDEHVGKRDVRVAAPFRLHEPSHQPRLRSGPVEDPAHTRPVHEVQLGQRPPVADDDAARVGDAAQRVVLTQPVTRGEHAPQRPRPHQGTRPASASVGLPIAGRAAAGRPPGRRTAGP